MSQKNRALFIDLLKGLALIVMVEVHVFNALISPELKNTWLFARLNFINGLVAPAFSFASGLVFVLSMQRGAEELRTFGKVFWRKLSRIGLILLIGYSLHLPYFSLTKILRNQTQPVLESLYTVDILQLIATGLIVLFFAKIFIKNEKRFFNFSLLMTVLVLVLSPVMWSIDFSNHLPLLFSNYFNRMHGSLFPLFPWWAFVFSGAYVAKYYIQAKNENKEPEFAKRLIYYGTAFYLISVILMYFIFPLFDIGVRPNPLWFTERFGVILLSLGIFWFYLNKKENYKSLILDVSRESLLIYWVHLQLIYRELIGARSLVQISNQNYNFLECTVVTIILIGLMLVLAKAWNGLKGKYPLYTKRFTAAVIGISLLIFLVR
ncbi:MAG: hypothetical protein CVV24_04255 [Ignavibacteriae bacterium HGW-Ignavibacteriae-3]|nr:MAG: hypothetical protein CVV24_04255 [Ignavibacteriae bacterium HGW-Ignavibacteriae-3]